jgi:hypothetical protein
MFGFETHGGNFIDHDEPVNVANSRMGQTQQATSSLSCPVLAYQRNTSPKCLRMTSDVPSS